MDLSGESAGVAFAVSLGHRCCVVNAHICRFVAGEEEGVGVLDPSLCNFFPVDVERARTTRSWLPSVVGEVERDRRLSRR